MSQDRAFLPVTAADIQSLSDPSLGPSLDWDEIEKASELTFGPMLRDWMQLALNTYALRCKTQNIPAGKAKRALEKVKKACEVLEEYLEIMGDTQVVDPVKAAVLWTIPKGNIRLRQEDTGQSPAVSAMLTTWWRRADSEQVLGFLSSWRASAEEEARSKGKAGKRPNLAIQPFIREAYRVYCAAGGSGKGCYRSGYSAHGFAGRFYDLVYCIIGKIGFTVTGITPIQLGKFIESTL